MVVFYMNERYVNEICWSNTAGHRRPAPHATCSNCVGRISFSLLRDGSIATRRSIRFAYGIVRSSVECFRVWRVRAVERITDGDSVLARARCLHRHCFARGSLRVTFNFGSRRWCSEVIKVILSRDINSKRLRAEWLAIDPMIDMYILSKIYYRLNV